MWGRNHCLWRALRGLSVGRAYRLRSFTTYSSVSYTGVAYQMRAMSATTTKTAATKGNRLPGPQRREQILDVTKALAGERGFHGISIDAVARRAGITRPVVYSHFDDLAGLLRAMVEREGARAVEQLMALIPQETDANDPA